MATKTKTMIALTTVSKTINVEFDVAVGANEGEIEEAAEAAFLVKWSGDYHTYHMELTAKPPSYVPPFSYVPKTYPGRETKFASISIGQKIWHEFEVDVDADQEEMEEMARYDCCVSGSNWWDKTRMVFVEKQSLIIPVEVLIEPQAKKRKTC